MARKTRDRAEATSPTEDQGSLDRLRRELARGTVELAVLSVLGAGRRYGYELSRVLVDLTGGVPEIKEGTLYPLLHRLEDAGLVEASWEASDRGRGSQGTPRTPPRKYYRLSPAGEKQLEVVRGEWEQLVEGMQRLLRAVEGVRR